MVPADRGSEDRSGGQGGEIEGPRERGSSELAADSRSRVAASRRGGGFASATRLPPSTKPRPPRRANHFGPRARTLRATHPRSSSPASRRRSGDRQGAARERATNVERRCDSRSCRSSIAEGSLARVIGAATIAAVIAAGTASSASVTATPVASGRQARRQPNKRRSTAGQILSAATTPITAAAAFGRRGGALASRPRSRAGGTGSPARAPGSPAPCHPRSTPGEPPPAR